MLETGIQLPWCQLEPEMTKEKILIFWSSGTCQHTHTLTHAHTPTHMHTPIDWGTNGLGSSLPGGGPAVE